MMSTFILCDDFQTRSPEYLTCRGTFTFLFFYLPLSPSLTDSLSAFVLCDDHVLDPARVEDVRLSFLSFSSSCVVFLSHVGRGLQLLLFVLSSFAFPYSTFSTCCLLSSSSSLS
jgi:hypothetical protein